MKKTMTVILSALIIICSITCVLIAPTSAAVNLWANISADDWYTRQTETAVSSPADLVEDKLLDRYPDSFSFNSAGKTFTVDEADADHYYIKMPVLEANKDYSLAFNYDATINESGTPYFYKLLLVPEASMSNQQYCWDLRNGSIYSGRSFIGISDIAVKMTLNAENKTGKITYDFNTKAYTQYYLFIQVSDVSKVIYSNFTITDPTDTTPDEEVDNPAELWKSVSIDDWYTRHVHEPAASGLDIPESKMTDRYGADFTYDAVNDSFNLKNAHGRHYYVKMPELQKSKDYTLSFNYNVNYADGSSPTLHKALLVPKSALTSTFCFNTYGEIYADRTFIGIQNIVIRKALTTNSDTVTFNFNSGNFTEYYLFIMFNNITEVTYSDFSVIDPELVVDPEEPDDSILAPESNDDNLGSVTAEIENVNAGDKVTLTATPLKGNAFEGWYDSKGTLLSTDLIFEYTVPADLTYPRAVFKSGEVEVPNASLEDSTKSILAYYSKDKGFTKVINDDNYDVEYAGTPAWEVNIQATNQQAHTGSMSIKIQTQYAFSGRHFKGLEKNTDYAISFWAYIEKDSGLSLNAMVLPHGVKPYKERETGGYYDYPLAEALGSAKKAATATSTWQEVVVTFNTGDNTDFTLWFISRGANSDRCWVDDFAIYKPANFDVIADLGGSVTSTATGSLPKGSSITVNAIPSEGNNFKHWLDKDGNVVSSDAEYTFTLNGDTTLKAVFGGYNKPARELFAIWGEDGTFENGTISGFYADDPDYGNSVGHCKWAVSDKYAYEGTKSLAVTSYYRNTILPITGLNKNTDYKFSFYLNFPYNGPQTDWNQVNGIAICGANDKDGASAETVYAQANSYIAGDSGWHKVELYFNTGDATAVNFIIRYAGEPKLASNLYLDNVELYEYYSANELANSDMTDSITPWLGNGTYSDNTMKLDGADASAYQLLNLTTYQKYTVKFRAKGNVFASASYISATVPSVLNALSSQSFVSGSSTDWKEYSFEFYSGLHRGAAIMFKAVDGTVYIDDVTITRDLSPIGAIVEKVDFETQRFDLKHSDKNVYEIYTATSNKDNNVYSGNKSLHFKATQAQADVSYILDEAFLSYGVAKNNNYKLVLYYKLAANSLLHIEPNFPATYFAGEYADYSGELGKEHEGNGNWVKLEYIFTAREFGMVKTSIFNIIGATKSDFYIDDITITVSSDMVIDPNTDEAYCSNFYNLVENGDFEEEMTANAWPGLPADAKVITAEDADTGTHYLRVKAGTKYILPFDLNSSDIYYFGATIRTSAKGKGSIALATMVEPNVLYFMDSNDNVASVIAANNSTEWKRGAFGFRSSPTGKTYLIIECTEGYMDVDTVSLCLEKYTFTENPNRYYEHIPFDYDNIDPSLIVYNGGFDKNGNIIIEGTTIPAPETGDNTAPALISIILAICSVFALLLLKRKDEANV